MPTTSTNASAAGSAGPGTSDATADGTVAAAGGSPAKATKPTVSKNTRKPTAKEAEKAEKATAKDPEVEVILPDGAYGIEPGSTIKVPQSVAAGLVASGARLK